MDAAPTVAHAPEDARLPLANAGTNGSALVGRPVLVDGSASYDPGQPDPGVRPRRQSGAHFKNQKVPYFLTLPATIDNTYIDLAVEFSGYLYVISADANNVHRLDIYHRRRPVPRRFARR